jgi:hypothetical protein
MAPLIILYRIAAKYARPDGDWNSTPVIVSGPIRFAWSSESGSGTDRTNVENCNTSVNGSNNSSREKIGRRV